jgi:hypothetical protein
MSETTNITYTLKINEETTGRTITNTNDLLQELQALKEQGETIITLEASPFVDGVIIIQGIGRVGFKQGVFKKRYYENYDIALTRQESDGSFKLYASYLKWFEDVEQFFADFFERQIVPDINNKEWEKM